MLALSKVDAIPAFNFDNMEQMQAIIKAAVETKSPVILQYLRVLVVALHGWGAVEYAKELGCKHPVEIVLHHGDTLKLVKAVCIQVSIQ